MTHFLRQAEAARGTGLWDLLARLGRKTERWACVTVKLEFRQRQRVLVVKEGAIGVLRADAQLAELPDDVLVVGPDDERIKPTGKFYVTTETFDPYHAVTDMFEENPWPKKRR